MYDIIIVGAGPAGLTAAIYAKRSNKSVLVFESTSPGGSIINALKIDNYPVNPGISGFDFAMNLYNQTKDLGVEFKFERVTSINNYDDHKEVVTSKGTYEAKSIILATGSSNKTLEKLARFISYPFTHSYPSPSRILFIVAIVGALVLPCNKSTRLVLCMPIDSANCFTEVRAFITCSSERKNSV